ncbi:MAG TPA: MerR family transcriptional regulator [Gaiellaceae bacterium]|nr:MerR family transcriptional regulator [Gaiellaceae bacterium]
MHTLRIGELARRTGVSPELLRAWERRYELLRPERTPTGYRLYSEDDVARVLRMQDLLRSGLAAAEAARQASDAAPAPTTPPLAVNAGRLTDALARFDDAAAHDALDQLLAQFTGTAVLEHVVLPVLRDLGERWAGGDASVAEEHFASSLLRGRLLGLARGWDRGGGPRAVLACAPGELHELGLIAFGIALRTQGWRITYLGADTPAETLVTAVAAVAPAAVVVVAVDSARVKGEDGVLATVARLAPLWVAGAVDAATAERLGARLLAADPIGAAELVAGSV